MKLNVVSLMFFTAALSSGAQTVLSDPEHQAKYEAALQDAARYKAEQQYYDNWVRGLQWLEPIAIAGKTTADWTFNYQTKIATFAANKYDDYFAPKFEDSAAGYEAERQYYERRVNAIEPYEGRLKILEATGEAAQAMLAKDIKKTTLELQELALGWGYNVATDPQTQGDIKTALNQVGTSAAGVAGIFTGQDKETANTSPAQTGQASSVFGGVGQTVFGSGGTNGVFSSTNNATQAWGSQNDGSWQCLPSQWNSQNNPVAWPKN